MGEKVLKREIELLLDKYIQITRKTLLRKLNEKGILFTHEELCNVLGALLDEDKIILTKW